MVPIPLYFKKENPHRTRRPQLQKTMVSIIHVRMSSKTHVESALKPIHARSAVNLKYVAKLPLYIFTRQFQAHISHNFLMYPTKTLECR